MKSIISCFIFTLVITNFAFSNIKFKDKGDLTFKLMVGTISTGRFFDNNGNSTDNLLVEGSEDLERFFEYSETNFGLSIEYQALERLILKASIPFRYATLSTKEQKLIPTLVPNNQGGFDTIQTPTTLAGPAYSLTQPNYFSIGADYIIFKKNSFAAIRGEVRMPPGFNNGIIDDPDHEFLADGAWEYLFGLVFGSIGKEIALETSMGYIIRNEEYINQYFLNFEFGLTKVEDTKLKLFGQYLQSTENYENAIQFDPIEIPVQETFLEVGLGFEIYLEQYSLEFNYSIRPLGKGTWSVGRFNVLLGVTI